MKNFYRCMLLIAAISFAIPLEASHPFAGGQGTENEPYQIQTADQLNSIRGEYLDKYFVQISHIDLGISPYNSGNGWNPIGGNNTTHKFTGHYDAGGYMISNLYINRPGDSNIGLFGHIGLNGSGATSIRNVKLENVNITGGRGTGSLIGRVTGNQNTRVEDCSVNSGDVRGDGATGGLVGSNNSYMTNSAAAESFRPVIYRCSAAVSVSLRDGAGGNKDKFGGLAGCNQKGLISNCYAHGPVSVDGGTRVGGLAGCVELRGIIINSYSTGSVTGNDTSLQGGLLGMSGSGSNRGTTTDCFWNIETSGVINSAGGTGLTNTQIRTKASFSNWDFETIWEMEEGVSYPVIRNQHVNAIIWVWKTSASDTDWNKSSNWVDQTTSPNSFSSVLVPSGASFYPVVSENIIVDKLEIKGGATLTINGSTQVFIKDSIIGSGTISGDGTLVLQGKGTQTISSMVFNNLTIDNPNNVRLGGDISVNGNLEMERGFLDLNGHIITLGESAFMNETETENTSSRVYGENGYIQTTQMLDNPQGENIGGMGIQITANNMGSTTISRGHSIQFDDDTSESIMRWFDITPSINTALNATLVFHYSSGEVNLPSEFDDIGFFLYKRTTDPEEWVHIVSVLDTEARTLTAENLGGFSRWTAGSSLIHLPVALLSFDAEVRNNDIILKWSTASEINNDYFTVERSIDGQTFEPVGMVEGAGNSNRLITYSKTDPNPKSGVSYYRLKQTDFDGTYEYSPMVSVELKERVSNMITLFPNPNNGEFNISNMGETKVPFRIYDMQGRMVFASETEPMSNHAFGSGQLKMGLYNVVFESTERHTLKMQVR